MDLCEFVKRTGSRFSKKDGLAIRKDRFTFPPGIIVKCWVVVSLNLLELKLCEVEFTETSHHIFATDRDSEAAIFVASRYQGSHKARGFVLSFPFQCPLLAGFDSFAHYLEQFWNLFEWYFRVRKLDFCIG